MSAFRPRNSKLKVTKGEKTRARLLDAAVRCFVVQGWEGASMAELARAGGVNRSLFIHYFDSKEKLIAECMAYVGERGRELTERFEAEDRRSANAAERYIRASFRIFKEHPELAAFLWLAIHRATYDPATRAIIEAIFAQAWKALVERMKKDPKLARHAKLETARRIHMSLLGGATAALVDSSRDVEDHEERVLATIAAFLT
jgi:AcrR family transcriptional regulator